MATLTWAHTGKRFAIHRFSPEIREQIKELNKSDNWHSLLFFAQDVFWVGLCVVACHLVSWWLYPVALIIVGARQRALSTIFHDSVHGIAADNRFLQMLLGTVLTAYPIFQQHYAYKISHVYTHHPKLGDPEADPDLMYFIEEKIYTPVSYRKHFNHIVVFPALGVRTWSFLRYLARTRFRVLMEGGRRSAAGDHIPRYKKVLDRTGFWLFWLTVVVGGWQIGLLSDVVLFWVLPYLTTFQVLSWYIELAEHTPLVRDHNVDLYMTRNRKSRGLEKFLAGIHNDHYHWDHHLDPRTPCWNLPKAHEIRMRDEEYAALDRTTGGLLTRGPEGQPSTISVIVAGLADHPQTAPPVAGGRQKEV